MEPVSFAVGVVGLAGLFTTCLDVIERVDSYKEYGVELRSLIAQYEADKLLFQRWGKSVGLEQNDFSEKHHSILQDPQLLSTVEKILTSVRELYTSADKTQLAVQTVPKSNQISKSSTGITFTVENRAPDQTAQKSGSRRKKLAWALRKKAKFIAQVQQFGALVQRLQSLVMSADMKGASSHQNDPDNARIPRPNGV